jgi:hypothetical protein
MFVKDGDDIVDGERHLSRTAGPGQSAVAKCGTNKQEFIPIIHSIIDYHYEN